MTDKHGIARGAVVVTGTSTGIGRACAIHLDRIGFRVFAGVRRIQDGESLKLESTERITPVLINVTDEATLVAAGGQVAKAVGDEGLSGLVNNAGIAVGGPLEFLPISEIRKQFEVNVLGQIAVIQAFLPLLRKTKSRIVNVGSIAGRMAVPFIGPYSASKFALEAITDSLRIELMQWGIKVSLIEPGSVKTPIWKKSGDAADKTLQSFSQRAIDLYGPAITVFRSVAEKNAQTGIGPDIVVRAIEHALTAKRPQTRYLVGREAHLRAFLKKVLPDWMLDQLVIRSIGLSRKA
jgi:NAD(P)-dependent dehydrogenase (short-subunit alcohol dehydrogenase family)